MFITILFFALLVIFVVTGVAASPTFAKRQLEESFFKGRVIARDKEGSFILLKDGRLCYLKNRIDLNAKVMVTFPKDTKSQEKTVDCAFLDALGETVFVIRRIDDNTVLCQQNRHVFLVWCSKTCHPYNGHIGKNSVSYFRVKKNGSKNLPICQLSA